MCNRTSSAWILDFRETDALTYRSMFPRQARILYGPQARGLSYAGGKVLETLGIYHREMPNPIVSERAMA
jgi:hypothetical protein